ncbi:TetR/AcrR family transcriptional regulator [Laribacter hongkongensis]|uniref:TetR/AcrR family transcriptional regulator n=1 Tax=Laribacter hongkongensis TaxID=168471 RepID=A0ABD4SQ60_9NEIS|nr:TetR/AcrR family transcriptional regulator [Laribacter hongkongensis]MCG9024964.1 TetR/AcrR family transcriptional regulator [Laribacter hongkongensis]MCG9052170.1 TetR/AcrR family transcriptional regulator [Laribacter hongkongensis]MCG9055561.1 TetR/AcrR family transcriptional regulator [Laribacter hongkongensis]MCG9057886.1 TetR/AcrR family transcriptional regulator [Laribacter hongkongensis]MCG9084013.1 TetR/AcrR family transcriptional regulator [Laribacter hongkongensis]
MKPSTSRKPGRQHDPQLAEARRQQILDAAADCFRRHGYHGASMAQICRTAGMSAGHVYHFFASKDDIITAIISRDLQQLFSLMAEIAARPESLHAALVNSVQRGVDDNLEPTYSALQLEMLAEAARNPHVASILREADASARQHLRELLLGDPAQPAIAPELLDSTLEVISTLFNGLLIRAVLHPELDRAALTEQVQHVMRSLLARLSLPPR